MPGNRDSGVEGMTARLLTTEVARRGDSGRARKLRRVQRDVVDDGGCWEAGGEFQVVGCGRESRLNVDIALGLHVER